MEKVPAGSGGPGTPVPDIPSWSARDYGNRVGVFRLMRVMERHGIRGTVALNSDLCAHHPEIIAEGQRLGWEWMGHCESNTRRLNEAPPGEEEGIIRRTFDTIEKATGTRPRGLARLRTAGDLGHARSACGGGRRVCLRLDQRRPALPDEPRRRAAARRHALQPRDQRQAGVREIPPHRATSSAR